MPGPWQRFADSGLLECQLGQEGRLRPGPCPTPTCLGAELWGGGRHGLVPTMLLLDGSRPREHWALMRKGYPELLPRPHSGPGLVPSSDPALCFLVFFLSFFKNNFYFEKVLKYRESTQGNVQLLLRTDNCSYHFFPNPFLPWLLLQVLWRSGLALQNGGDTDSN